MFNSIAKLFGHQRNPTAEWPPHTQRELVYDTRSRSLNGLKLDAAFSEARVFGQCDSFDLYGNGMYLDLFYRQSGLSLEFASDRLISVVLVVARGALKVKGQDMGVCVPTIIDFEGKRHVFNDASTLQDLTLCFGQPIESDDHLHTFAYHKNSVDSFHDQTTGKLLHLEICETNDA